MTYRIARLYFYNKLQHASLISNNNNNVILALPIPDLVNYHAPIFMDGWNSNNGEYIALLAEAPFALESTWKLIWDQKVSFVVTILTSVSKVSRSG